MKLDGAFKPQGAFPYVVESSIGAKNRKYRDKFYNNNHNNNSIIYKNKKINNNNSNINNTYNNNNCNKKNSNIHNSISSSNNNSNSRSKIYLNFKEEQKINNLYKNCIQTNTANANNIKHFNENLTQLKDIKGLKKSLKVDNTSNNNINNNDSNNINNNSLCCISKKVTTTLTLKKSIKNQLLPVVTSEIEANNNTVEKERNITTTSTILYDLKRYREILNNINKNLTSAVTSRQHQFDFIKIKMRSIQSSISSFMSSALAGYNVGGNANEKNGDGYAGGTSNGKLGFLNSISFIYYFLFIFFIFSASSNYVKCDESDFFSFNPYSLSPDSSQPDFDYASRGIKYFGDKCDNTLECGFPGSICDPKKKTCRCVDERPVTNHIDKCGVVASHNESCFFNEQCEAFHFKTECRDGRCICKFDLQPVYNNGNFECGAKQVKPRETHSIDPAMIGVLCGMALMFIIICVVLRLFSQARWRENRTIFNTPNPRLMNVSLLRESKLLHGQERRGSRMSVRGPSRQPSMASLRPHSPNPSLASRNSNSNGSVASIRSRCDSTAAGSIKGHHPQHHHGNRKNSQQSNQQTPLITHVTPNPAAESVTIEIIEPTTKATSNHTDI